MSSPNKVAKMNSQVLVDREVLDRCCKRMYDMMQGDLHKQLRALLAPIPDAGEVAESWLAETPGGGSAMVISLAQHRRIVSALQAGTMLVPDGYALVLVEPTRQMAEALFFDGEDYTNSKDFDDFKRAWPNLLAASTAPGGGQ